MKRHPSSSFDEGFHLERRALTPRGSPTKNHHPVPLKRGRRKREEEEEREAGGGGGARSIICSTKGERGAAKSKGGSSNPPLSPMDKPADLAEIQRFMAFISEDRRGKERLMDLKSATV